MMEKKRYIFVFNTSDDENVSDQYGKENWWPLWSNLSAVQMCDSC